MFYHAKNSLIHHLQCFPDIQKPCHPLLFSVSGGAPVAASRYGSSRERAPCGGLVFPLTLVLKIEGSRRPWETFPKIFPKQLYTFDRHHEGKAHVLKDLGQK